MGERTSKTEIEGARSQHEAATRLSNMSLEGELLKIVQSHLDLGWDHKVTATSQRGRKKEIRLLRSRRRRPSQKRNERVHSSYYSYHRWVTFVQITGAQGYSWILVTVTKQFLTWLLKTLEHQFSVCSSFLRHSLRDTPGRVFSNNFNCKALIFLNS